MDMKFFYKKRVLITGHTGFKGSWLSKILLKYGADVLGYSLECSTEPSMFKILNLESQMKSVIGDVRDFNKLKETIINFKPEIVIHMAAQALVGDANNNPKDTYETNIIGTVNLFEAIRYCDSVKSVVNVSTDAVYLYSDDKIKYNENDRIGGKNTYSSSKSCSELIVSNYRNLYLNNIGISNTRTVNVIGGGDFNNTRILPSCVLSWMNNDDIKIKSPNSIRPFLHVLEVLYGYLLIAKKQYEDKNYGSDYNFSPLEEDYITMKDLATLFCNKIDNVIKWLGNSDEYGEKKIIDSTKAKNILGWKSYFTLEERIQSIIDWNKALLNNEDMNFITDKQISDFFRRIY